VLTNPVWGRPSGLSPYALRIARLRRVSRSGLRGSEVYQLPLESPPRRVLPIIVTAGLATLRLASIGFVQTLGPAMAIVSERSSCRARKSPPLVGIRASGRARCQASS
jgi:hypothetical protein